MRKELENNIINWGRAKGINDPINQTLKTVEEVGELAGAILKGNHEDVIDAIGDIEVCLIILKDILNLKQDEPLLGVWNEIKDREGRTVDGVFIKE